MICLYFWIISFGFMTVYTIKLGDSDKINEETKDLSILVCTTIIASGILIMDIISRAMEEKNKIKEEHKEDDKI